MAPDNGNGHESGGAQLTILLITLMILRASPELVRLAESHDLMCWPTFSACLAPGAPHRSQLGCLYTDTVEKVAARMAVRDHAVFTL